MRREAQGRIGARIAAGSALKSEEAGVLHKLVTFTGLRDEEGQDLVEYGLLVAFCAVAGTAIFTALSDDIAALWTTIATRLASST